MGFHRPRQEARMFSEVERVREEAESLLRRQYRAQWDNWVQGASLEVAGTYRGHEWLFSTETIGLVEEALRAAEGVESVALRYFRNHLLVERIALEVAELEDRIVNLQAAAVVEVDGVSVPFRQLNTLIANEPDSARRRRLADSAAPVLARLNPLLAEKLARSRQLAEGLGWSYTGLSGELREADLPALAVQARHLLDRTDELYHRSRRAATPLIGEEDERLQGCDLPRLFKGGRFEENFPATGLLETVSSFLAGIGINMEDQSGLRIHLEDHRTKNPRAVCFPIEVPGDIRLSVKPVGGAMDYRALFHEMGHAQHFLHTTTPYFEFRYLGSYTTTEAYASLFEGMMEHPDFLAGRMGLSEESLNGYLTLTVFQKLFLIRRYAAKLLYELELHEGMPQARERYRRLQQEATGLNFNDLDAERYLLDVDPFFYSADYFRAWQLEAMLDHHLDAEHGAPWFAHTSVSGDLRFLWAVGSAQSGRELAAGLGWEDTLPGPMLERIIRYAGRCGL
jgi:hypothetical protein